MSRTLGLLELCHYHGSEKQPEFFIHTGSQPPNLGFNHLGFSVPDVRAAVERLRQNGVSVVKDVDEGPNDSIPATKWERDEKGIATEKPSVGFEGILIQIAFVRDPVSPILPISNLTLTLTLNADVLLPRMVILSNWFLKICQCDYVMPGVISWNVLSMSTERSKGILQSVCYLSGIFPKHCVMLSYCACSPSL